MATKPIPEGYHTTTPYLCVKGATDAIEFYKKAFGATEVMRMGAPDGKVGHAELQFGDSRVMLADEFPVPQDDRRLAGDDAPLRRGRGRDSSQSRRRRSEGDA
jgi:catechol 2,3-dioxygenase-like lactoylglutathione lyase family enzyme